MMASDSPAAQIRRSVLVTILGWLIAAGAALLSVVSFFALLMVIVGQDGAKNTDVAGFLLVIVAPPVTAFAGVGLALRWRWAWYYLVAGCLALALWNGVEMLRHPEPTVTTTVDPSGLRTTTYRSAPTYGVPLIVLSAGLLALLLLPKVRREFAGTHDGKQSAQTHAVSAPAGGRDKARGWRVGHQGRDAMYYEELQNGSWQRIDISGEMLMGRAHHVIYFPSVELWQQMPEWARDRRDEIIARIKSEFRAPDYEYYGDGAPSAPAGNIPAVRGSARDQSGSVSQQMLALVAFVGVLLAFAGYMGWNLMGGLDTQTVTLPIPREALQRPVLRDQEPMLFWFSMGIYFAAGAAALWVAGWMSGLGWKARREAL